MLIYSRTLEDKLYEYIPLKDSNVDLIAKDIGTTVRASTIGIPLIAVIQGVVGLIGYLFIGVQDPFFGLPLHVLLP
jgi:Domain of unknown function DUF20.